MTESTTDTPAVPATGVALIAEHVKAVALHRSIVKGIKGALDKKRLDFNSDNALLIASATTAQARVEEAENALRALTLAHYKATREAKPTAGVDVRIRKGLRYAVENALAWARGAKMATIPEQLDVKAFEKIASVTDLDFVEKTETPMVFIASDLDKALGGAA